MKGFAQFGVEKWKQSLDTYAKDGDATTGTGDQEALPPVMSGVWSCVY